MAAWGRRRVRVPGDDGWYYDDPADPLQIRLCPRTCERVVGEKGTLRIGLGCDTILF